MLEAIKSAPIGHSLKKIIIRSWAIEAAGWHFLSQARLELGKIAVEAESPAMLEDDKLLH